VKGRKKGAEGPVYPSKKEKGGSKEERNPKKKKKRGEGGDAETWESAPRVGER